MLQGGSADAPDTFRGYLNEGGLYAERIGAHLPNYPDLLWKQGTPLSGGGISVAGVNFFRTTFNLVCYHFQAMLNSPDNLQRAQDLPPETDVPVRLSITPSVVTSNFRVQIYLNGWQLGKYINNFG